MSRYQNDHGGVGSVVGRMGNYLRYYVNGAYAISMQLEDARPFVGPYPVTSGARWFHRKLNLLLNRLLWRQHAFNQQVFRGLQDSILMEAENRSFDPNRPLIGVLVPYDVTENITGGSSRLWGLCEALTPYYRVQLLTLTRWWKTGQRKKIYPGVDLLSFPLSSEIEEQIKRNTPKWGNASPFLSMSDPSVAYPLLDAYLEKMGPEYCALIMDSPYLYDRMRRACPDLPLIYETPNVNIDYLGRMAGDKMSAAVPILMEMEARAIKDAEFIMGVSEHDLEALSRHYPDAAGKVHLIPNGVSVTHAYRAFPSESMRLCANFGFNQPAVLFVGSVLVANIQAMTYIIERMAPAFRQVQWVIVGVTIEEYMASAGTRSLPANVLFTGRVPEAEKEAVMALCCLAIAPIEIGTGSSLKIPDYIAHGKPVITTPTGLRGFDHLRSHVDVADLDHFEAVVRTKLEALNQDPAALDRQAEQAWSCVRDTLDWPVIAGQLQSIMALHSIPC